MTHHYNCSITFGNISTLETNTHKEAVKNFLASFLVRDFEIKEHTNDYGVFYSATIRFTNIRKIKVERFSQAIIAFALYYGFPFEEG